MQITRFTKEEIVKVPNGPGIYAFFNRQQGIIYVGTSQVLKHRIQSYYQEDDFGGTPDKGDLQQFRDYLNEEFGIELA